MELLFPKIQAHLDVENKHHTNDLRLPYLSGIIFTRCIV